LEIGSGTKQKLEFSTLVQMLVTTAKVEPF